jgi:phosphatidylethanolamine/phosphatidyl-N-methylethanolamine N-methyltransferase
MILSETFSFWRAWLRAPRRVGAVAPSGSSLARLMTRHVDHRHGPVIELGPGTGVFTRALLAGGLPMHRLALVEADAVFADALTQRYPQALVRRMDAAQLGDTPPLFGDDRASAVISGLPLLSMPPGQVAAIVRGVFEQQLHANGALYQFTYGYRCPLPRRLLEQLDLEAVRVGSVLFNLPPATVYRIGRRQRRRVAV